MGEELYINDIKTNLFGRSVSMNYQINDVGSIVDRQADYSNAIKIPKTPENMIIMNFLSVGGSTSRRPYETVKVKYIVHGIEIISSGNGVLTDTGKEFSLVVYDGNISMKDLLADSKLEDLDWSPYAHTLNQTEFFASFANTSGYIYGLGKFYELGTINPIAIDLQSPSFYIHTLFSMIFNSRGYTVSGDIFSDADYTSRVISMHRGYNRYSNKTTTVKRTFNAGTLGTFDISSGIHPTGYEEIEIDTYTSVNSVNHNITIVGSLDVEIGINPWMLIKVDGVTIKNIQLSSDDGLTYPLDLDEFISVGVGDVISIDVAITAEDISGLKIKFDANFVNTYIESDASIEVDLTTLVGETKQIDFVKTIMQHFNLLFRKTRNQLNFEFKKFNSILTDRANAEDWSDKYSRFLKESYKTKYAKENLLKYRYDDDGTEVDQTWADGNMVLDNENLPATKTIVTSIFKASKLSGTLSVLRHWIKEDEDSDIESNEDGLRMFKVNRLNGYFDYKMLYEASGETRFTGDYPLLDFSSLYYQKEYENNYLNFKELQEDFNKISLELNLNILDIYDLDFFKLKYFEQTGHYYYLNKITGYKKNRASRTDLVRIGNDIIEGLSMSGNSSGASVMTGDLTKLSVGEISGAAFGSSLLIGSLSIEYAITTTAFTCSFGYVTDSDDVCTLTPSTTYYHDGAGSIPTAGDVIYSDSAGTNPLTGSGTRYYRLAAPYYIQLDVAGEVLAVTSVSC